MSETLNDWLRHFGGSATELARRLDALDLELDRLDALKDNDWTGLQYRSAERRVIVRARAVREITR